jgi:hypothetical protein
MAYGPAPAVGRSSSNFSRAQRSHPRFFGRRGNLYTTIKRSLHRQTTITQSVFVGGRMVTGKDVAWLGESALLVIGLLLMGLAVWLSVT